MATVRKEKCIMGRGGQKGIYNDIFKHPPKKISVRLIKCISLAVNIILVSSKDNIIKKSHRDVEFSNICSKFYLIFI